MFPLCLMQEFWKHMKNIKSAYLDNRIVLSITGEDARTFLHGVITNDIAQVDAGRMIYACLLTAQGHYLFDFFILPRGEGGYFLDCEAVGKDDLVRRLSMYKLRSKVQIQDTGLKVHCLPSPSKDMMIFPDPRLPQLGFRFYASEQQKGAGAVADYADFCISLGVMPDSRAARVGKDFLSDINLDLLHAVSWDKGCFIGQELTARIHNRGLAKKRLCIISGLQLAMGDIILQNGIKMGEIRAVDSTGKRGLALLKLSVFENTEQNLVITEKGNVSAQKPEYLL